MKVVVDFDLCESNALCMREAPEIFEVRDDDFLYVLDEFPEDELKEKVMKAVQVCPKQAISISDEEPTEEQAAASKKAKEERAAKKAAES